VPLRPPKTKGDDDLLPFVEDFLGVRPKLVELVRERVDIFPDRLVVVCMY
jgi:hypothetical protein